MTTEKEIKDEFKKFGITYKKDSFGRIDYFIYKLQTYGRGDSIGEIYGLNHLHKLYKLWLNRKNEIYKKHDVWEEGIINYNSLYQLIREIQIFIEGENEKRAEEYKYKNESYGLYCFEDYYKKAIILNNL